MFWTFIAAMYIGNLMLLVLNLPLVGLFGRIAAIRPQIIIPIVSVICLFGVYSVRNSIFDVWVMIISGVTGFVLRKRKFPIAPFIIGIVLAPTGEQHPPDVDDVQGKPLTDYRPSSGHDALGCRHRLHPLPDRIFVTGKED